MDVPDVGGTFLTERQAEVLESRENGDTQAEIADRIGTTVANVSAVESSARDNVARAHRTLTLARLLGATTRFRADAGTDLREIVDRTFAAGDDAGIRIAYPDPELTAHLRDHLDGRLDARTLTDDVQVGVSADGGVATYPSAILPDGSATRVTDPSGDPTGPSG